MSNIPKITPSEIAERLSYFASKGWNAFLHGAPGIGKSAIVKQWCKDEAKRLDLEFYEVGNQAPPAALDKVFAFLDVRAVLLDALDVKGGPLLDKGKMKTTFLPPSILPDEKVHGLTGYFFIDEIAQGATMVTNSLSQLIHDRAIGDNYVFPNGWNIGAASNRKEDQAATNKIGAQIYNRFGHFEVVPDVEDFVAYLLSQGSDGRLGAFLRLRPELLHKFERGDIAFPSPRVWEKADEAMGIECKSLRQSVIASLVGDGPSNELEGFLSMYTQLATWRQIEESPETARVPEAGEEGAIAATFAMIGMVANRATEETMDQVVIYISRFHKEFQMIWGLDVIKSSPDLQETVAFTKWRAANPDVAV